MDFARLNFRGVSLLSLPPLFPCLFRSFSSRLLVLSRSTRETRFGKSNGLRSIESVGITLIDFQDPGELTRVTWFPLGVQGMKQWIVWRFTTCRLVSFLVDSFIREIGTCFICPIFVSMFSNGWISLAVCSVGLLEFLSYSVFLYFRVLLSFSHVSPQYLNIPRPEICAVPARCRCKYTCTCFIPRHETWYSIRPDSFAEMGQHT